MRTRSRLCFENFEGAVGVGSVVIVAMLCAQELRAGYPTVGIVSGDAEGGWSEAANETQRVRTVKTPRLCNMVSPISDV